MIRKLVLAGALASVAVTGWVGFTQPSNAGWGPPFACGAGQKTQGIKWDQGIETPGAPAAAVTGGSTAKSESAPAVDEKEWTEEELKAGKPLFVYYYVEGMDAKNGAGDKNFKFSQSLEFGGFAEKVLDELNAGWRCKKVGLDLDADRKDPKNQARLEFWSFTGVRMGDVTLKETALLNPGPLKAALKNYRIKNGEICAKEIKRMVELKKAQERAEQESAAK